MSKEAQDKFLDYLSLLTSSLLCPSYHGTVKYNRVWKEFSELKKLVKESRE